jgi:hypothetical protein
MNRVTSWLATFLALVTVVALAPLAPAHAETSYFWAGATAQGKWLELTATPSAGGWTVSTVRLTGAVVKCPREMQDLDLSALDFTTSAEIGSAPFTIARLDSGDAQVALLIKGQLAGDNQMAVTVTVYWSRLSYANARDVVPAAQRCSAVIPATLQLFAVN